MEYEKLLFGSNSFSFFNRRSSESQIKLTDEIDVNEFVATEEVPASSQPTKQPAVNQSNQTQPPVKSTTITIRTTQTSTPKAPPPKGARTLLDFFGRSSAPKPV